MFTYIYPPQSVSVATPPVQFQLDGVDTTVSLDSSVPSSSNPFPVIQLDQNGNPASPLTDIELRAAPVIVDTGLGQPLTDAELRAAPVPVSGTVTANTGLTQPLTDAQLRATPVPVSGTVTANTGLSQPLTDTQLRATAVPVSGSVSVSNFPSTQSVSAASLPLPTGASTLAEQQAQSILVGAVNETSPVTDTASSGLNGRLQRIAQRITSLIALIPASLGQKSMANSFAVTLASDQSTLPVAQAALTPSYQEITNLTITAQTFTAPVGAKWCKIYAEDTNVADIRVRIGGTATVTSGLQLQPGRSEDFNAVGNISVIAESGTNQKVNVHFGV